ncbi:MAG: Asparaginase, probable [Parcubacteria group bacterium]|nr:Asparaginase, probable [Parcubacteria group bacterium]
MTPRITFVLTGGTIDKEYDALDKAFTIGSGAVSRILGYVRPNFEATIIPVVQKVSVNILPEEKEAVRMACASAADDKIIVTYGTDAMTEIGEILKDIRSKTIVIVGALKSQLIKETDAEFNLGFAVAAVQTLPTGVYVAMSGRVYPWDKCKKNMTTGQFEEFEN